MNRPCRVYALSLIGILNDDGRIAVRTQQVGGNMSNSSIFVPSRPARGWDSVFSARLAAFHLSSQRSVR